MPQHNEGEFLFNFVNELETKISNLGIVIVDDKSSIALQSQLRKKFEKSNHVQLVFNAENMGHGISTLIALHKSIEIESEIIISVDGDGQFLVEDIKKCLNHLIENRNLEIIEGVRVDRINEPWFRKVVTTITRLLVYLKVKQIPKDANTPLRVYRREALIRILDKIPINSMIPNLHVSKLTRQMKLNFKEIEVLSLARGGGRGGNQNNLIDGVTWKQKFKRIPSVRFIKFCIQSILEWFNS
jgi:dolichol-phosphate mannosyltransferase